MKMILMPGQWKVVNGLLVENTTDKPANVLVGLGKGK